MPDDIERMRLFGLPPTASDYPEGSVERQVVEALEAAIAITEDLQASAREVSGSKELTAEGKRGRLAELGRDAQARLNGLGPRLDLYHKELRKRREHLAVEPRKAEPAEAVFHREIRDRLLGLPDVERQIVFDRAIDQGESAVLYAVAEAPEFFELLPADVLERGRQQWAAKLNPEAAREVEKLETVVTNFEDALESARAEVKNLTGVGVDPLAEMAAGKVPAG